MTLEEFKNVEASSIPMGKSISIIARSQNIYLNHSLKGLDINSTQLHLLFEISHKSNLNQESLASRCNINKGAVARSIRNLEEKGIIERKIDDENRRQNKLSITPKGRKIMKSGIEILNRWEREVLDDEMIDEETLKIVLKRIAVNSIALNQGGNESEQKQEH